MNEFGTFDRSRQVHLYFSPPLFCPNDYFWGLCQCRSGDAS
jgi:hypothetical protein